MYLEKEEYDQRVALALSQPGASGGTRTIEEEDARQVMVNDLTDVHYVKSCEVLVVSPFFPKLKYSICHIIYNHDFLFHPFSQPIHRVRTSWTVRSPLHVDYSKFREL